jgi:hypothetical protein
MVEISARTFAAWGAERFGIGRLNATQLILDMDSPALVGVAFTFG